MLQSRPLPLYHVDAFTDGPFSGNAAAVCILSEPAADSWLQQVAAEMNLSETAFLQRREGSTGEWDLRWFTPGTEVDLCGHATLASAHVLWETGHLQRGAHARFHTRSGWLTARFNDGWIEMAFPFTPAEPRVAVPGLLEALGTIDSVATARSRFDWLVELPSESAVRSLRPDFRRLKSIDCRGVIVTARGSGQYDFVSRFFAPGVGIDEDPVTGSAHCALAPWWSKRLGKRKLLAYQASARGGVVRMRLDEDAWLGGQAVTVFRGGIADAF